MPIVLYWMGDLSITGTTRIPACAVVGSRQPTCYGVSVTREISKGLTDHGVCIVSGLARGIDTVAHESALLDGGKTIAVLAGGLDEVYPPENRDLFEKICQKGLVLSEMPPGKKASRQYFPARNRILSGLSDLVAIMEAGEFSGTLHTASFAAAQGRDVFVVPGTIYAQQSRGNLKLIQDGADLLLSVEDILARLAGLTFFREMDEIRQEEARKNMSKRQKDHMESLSHEECLQVIIDQLSLCEQSMDELIQATGFSFSQTAPLLSELELAGRVVGQKQRYALTFLCV
jgi:DNA processing protein